MFAAAGLADASHTLTIEVTGRQNASATGALIVVDAFDVPAVTISRLQETDPSVAYTAGWVQDNPVVTLIPGITAGWTQGASLRVWSAGAALVSTTPGAQVTFTFKGTAIDWIGARGTQSGIARVSLDGVFVAEVDLYSPTEQIQAAVFTATGLADASHTLTIEGTGRQNAFSQHALIVVDAFDVTTSGTRHQDTDPAIAYGPDWIQGNRDKAYSEGASAESNIAGAQATITFTGTGISWIGARGTQSGIARVTLDGVFVTEVDLYSPTEQIQGAVFTATGLADTSHTLTIEVTGEQNTASTSPLIVVDAFEVTMSGTRHQDTDPAIAYGPNWFQDNRDKAYSEGASAESNIVGAQATITFTGTGISWIGARGPQCGIARIFLDGVFVEDFDTYAPTEGPQHTDFSRRGLAAGTHTLTIQVIGKNPISTDAWILIDAFDVIP